MINFYTHNQLNNKDQCLDQIFNLFFQNVKKIILGHKMSLHTKWQGKECQRQKTESKNWKLIIKNQINVGKTEFGIFEKQTKKLITKLIIAIQSM